MSQTKPKKPAYSREFAQREFDNIGIKLTPAGKWEYKGLKKHAIDALRKNHVSWDSYPNDNMAKHYLSPEQNLLVVDIDGEQITITNDRIVIQALDLELPLTFYSTTTTKNKFHFYYRVECSTDWPARVVGILDTKVDVFTYGNMFEWHSFSPHASVHPYPMATLEFDCPLAALLDTLDLPTQRTGDILPTPNVQRFNLINLFLSDNLNNNKLWFAFFRSVFPSEAFAGDLKKKRKLNIEMFPLNYDLFNKIAVKLTSTSQLDHYEHTIPALRKLLTMWGRNPDSTMSQRLMSKNILPSLPEHESILPYSLDDDVEDFQVHLDSQTGTNSPVFRIVDKTIKYIEINKITQEPISHGDSFFIDVKAAQALHPERNITNEEGRVVAWDDDLPIVYTMNSPYEPQYLFDESSQRHIVNLYTPSKYVKQALPARNLSTKNIISKLIDSTIGPQYRDIVLDYMAQVVFGSESPTTVLWMGALETEKGGSGKSAITLEIPSLILQGAASAIDAKTITSGWGDVVKSAKLISLEDLPKQSTKEWELVYSMIKQQNTNSYRKLNMKHGAISSERISIALTGSSNYRLALSPSDRRFLCLEPAHFHGITEPMNNADALYLAQLLSSHEYSEEVQEFTNHLYYRHSSGFNEETTRALFIEAPQTVYRDKWVVGGANNSMNLVNNLWDPVELHSHMKYTQENQTLLTNLYQILVHAYNPDTGRTAVSYKWFENMLPFVQADQYADNKYSQANIANMLKIDLKNVGTLYSVRWKKELPTYLPQEWADWPNVGYNFKVTQSTIEGYKTLIKELLPKPVNNLEEVAV